MFPGGGGGLGWYLGILADRYDDIFDFDTHPLSSFLLPKTDPLRILFPNLTHLGTLFVVQNMLFMYFIVKMRAVGEFLKK